MASQDLNDPAVMEKRTARFKNLTPTKNKYEDPRVGIPAAAYQELAARDIYLIMAPTGVARGGTSRPAVEGEPGVEVSIVECPPGNGAALHIHGQTYETFMPLNGRYQIIWGNEGEHSKILEPYDLITVPAGIYRGFRNVDDHPAKMLVLMQGGREIMNDVTFHHEVGTRILKNWGEEIHGNFPKIGIRFADPPAVSKK